MDCCAISVLSVLGTLFNSVFIAATRKRYHHCPRFIDEEIMAHRNYRIYLGSSRASGGARILFPF
jgi:hypothetical protein